MVWSSSHPYGKRKTSLGKTTQRFRNISSSKSTVFSQEFLYIKTVTVPTITVINIDQNTQHRKIRWFQTDL